MLDYMQNFQKKNVSDVSLANLNYSSKAQVEKLQSVILLTVNISDFTEFKSATFAPFDADRYSISKKTSVHTIHEH